MKSKRIQNKFLHLSDMKSDNASSEKKMNVDVKIYEKKYKREEEDEEDIGEINRNYWYRGELMQLVPDVFKELAENQEVVVEQKIELLEVLSGCETANRYNVYLLDKDKVKNFYLNVKNNQVGFVEIVVLQV